MSAVGNCDRYEIRRQAALRRTSEGEAFDSSSSLDAVPLQLPPTRVTQRIPRSYQPHTAGVPQLRDTVVNEARMRVHRSIVAVSDETPGRRREITPQCIGRLHLMKQRVPSAAGGREIAMDCGIAARNVDLNAARRVELVYIRVYMLVRVWRERAAPQSTQAAKCHQDTAYRC